MVNRTKATAHFHMPTPKRLTDVADIPRSLKITHGGEKFLYYDSGSDDPERLLIFAKPSNLGVLEDSERWYCDGTFSTSPDIFYQLYTIHGEVSLTNTYIIPPVYALLPNKKQETYSGLFKALNLNPSSVTNDFEMAVRNALKQFSTDVQISFCYFHFCQSLLRHVQNQGKTSRYGEAEDIYRKYVRMAAALAFLPAKDVTKEFELLKDCNSDSDISEFLEYFEKTYIGVPQQIGTGRRAPRFAVSEWSVYQAVMDKKVKLITMWRCGTEFSTTL